MENNKVDNLLDIIGGMDIRHRLRLAIRMSDSCYTNLMYDKPKLYEYFDSKLKEIDEEYRTRVINFNKYKNVTYVMSKIMELSSEEQNQVTLYVYNTNFVELL
ncbi:MAG: hypothetical protein IJH12_06445 [Clostridia bacterium]|nr:hypothetical protein [Clostridia bacterium]